MQRVALIATLGSLALASPAAAQHKAHISVAQARGAIVRYFGPGTVVTKCKQFAPALVGCDYETPSVNVGIVFEEEATGYRPESGTAYGYVTAYLRAGRLRLA